MRSAYFVRCANHIALCDEACDNKHRCVYVGNSYIHGEYVCFLWLASIRSDKVSLSGVHFCICKMCCSVINIGCNLSKYNRLSRHHKMWMIGIFTYLDNRQLL